jgi:hypothetical protein
MVYTKYKVLYVFAITEKELKTIIFASVQIKLCSSLVSIKKKVITGKIEISMVFFRVINFLNLVYCSVIKNIPTGRSIEPVYWILLNSIFIKKLSELYSSKRDAIQMIESINTAIPIISWGPFL